MSGRLILAIVSTLLEEAALVAIVLVGLPELGISIPLPGLIALMVAWAAVTVFTYRSGSRALRSKTVTGPGAILGRHGKVVSLSLIHISEPTRLRRISYAVFCFKN